MAYKWKPSASQRKAFAERMKDPTEQQAYDERQKEKANKRRATSSFDYESAGGRYVPTKEQHDFCFNHSELFTTIEEQVAMNEVTSGYLFNEKVNHDYIHIVNVKIRHMAFC